MEWLRGYTFALVFGVFALVLVGIASHEGSMSSPTGLVVLEEGTGSQSLGRTVEVKVISKDCVLTPARVYANAGDTVKLSATTYDASGRTHRMTVKGLGVELRVQGRDVGYAVFTPKKGTYAITDEYPCAAQGYKAETELIVS